MPPTLPTPFEFFLGPFRFLSEIDIPELRNSSGPALHTVSIRLGGVPADIPGAPLDNGLCRVAPTEYLLHIPGTASYYARNGNEVRVEIAPGAPLANVSTYLLGSVFGVLCHQNGMLPLHASAVESNGAVTAFLGHSGAGKSTLAAALHQRGHRIVSDDICLIAPGSGDPASLHVIPVAGWLKLWQNSLHHLGETPLEQNRVFSTDDKFRLYLDPAAAPQAADGLRLTRVIFLARAEDPNAAPTLEPIPTLEALTGLMDMTYAGYFPESNNQHSRVFHQCAAALAHATPFRLTLPWSLPHLTSTLNLLENEVLNPNP